jgi:predicted HAD superfamily Cof-like phosphohydrolase
MSVDFIEMWHKRARPEPTQEDFNVQLGCHFEEFREMLETIRIGRTQAGAALNYERDLHDKMIDLFELVDSVSVGLKAGYLHGTIIDREGFLDSIADQVVTVVGTAHCAGMQATEAVRRVNQSNWSKFDKDGQPIRDKNGKIAKGPDYKQPDLEGLY